MRASAGIQLLAILFCVSIIGTGNGYCQQVQTDTLSSYIEFGSGGGFSGAQQGYIITEAGLLFSAQRSINNVLKTTYIKDLKKSDVRHLFKAAQKIAASDLTFNEPGNTYSYMYYKTDSISKHYSWGNPSNPTPKQLVKLSSKLVKTTTP